MTQPQGSVSFDSVADQYDATRTMPEGLSDKQRDTILAELAAAGADRMLEVGIGTGLVSRPLMQRGIHVTGVDISPKMLGRLRSQLTGDHTAPHLLLGDATRLPFCDAVFPAVVMSHVFHVVSDVDATLDEIKRILVRGGTFLHDRTRYSENNVWHASYNAREEMLAELGSPVRHRPRPAEVEAKLTERGASLRVVRYAETPFPGVAKSLMRQARSNLFSWAWGIPEDVHAQFLEQFDHWCQEYYVDDEYTVSHEMEVWTFA